MIVKITAVVTPKRDGKIIWKRKVIGIVRRPKNPFDLQGRRKRPWECLQLSGEVELFVQQCDSRREGIVRLLILAGAV